VEYSFGHFMHTAKITLCNLFETCSYHCIIHVSFVAGLFMFVMCGLYLHYLFSVPHYIRKKECIQPIFVHTLHVCSECHLFRRVCRQCAEDGNVQGMESKLGSENP
jgi:hypothetical protein